MACSDARLWIDGAWTAAQSGARAASVNPGTGETLGELAVAGVADADAALAAARRVFGAGAWPRSPRLRAQVLLELATRLEARREELALALARENGKLLGDCRHEIAGAISELRYYAGLARTIAGRVLDLDGGTRALMLREPLGVAAIIVPWNAPIALLMRALAPALAAGCTAVVKAAPQTALVTAQALGALAEIEALPPGTVNLLFETGNDIGRHLVASTDVDMVSYTGSTEVGKHIMAAAAATLKRLNLELGGSAPCVVFADADLDAAAAGIARSALTHAGQVCVAASRVIAEDGCADALAARLVERLGSARLGLADDPDTQLGPLIDRPSGERIRELVAGSAAHGEVLLRADEPGGALAGGAFVTPGLVRIERTGSALLREEVFGPVLSVQTFRGEAEGVAKANASRFGLAASVWTRDHVRAQRVAAAIRAGSVWINGHMRLFPEVETGGFRDSGLGRLHGVEGLEAFLQTKAVSWELGGGLPVEPH